MIIQLRKAHNTWCTYAYPGVARYSFEINSDGTPNHNRLIEVNHNGCIGPACHAWRWTRPEYKDSHQAHGVQYMSVVDYQGFCGHIRSTYESLDYSFNDRPAGNLECFLK